MTVIFAPFLHKCTFLGYTWSGCCSRRTGVDTADLSYSKWNIWSCLFLEADPTLCFKFIFIYQRKDVSGDPVCSLGLFFIMLLKRKEPTLACSGVCPFLLDSTSTHTSDCYLITLLSLTQRATCHINNIPFRTVRNIRKGTLESNQLVTALFFHAVKLEHSLKEPRQLTIMPLWTA